MEIWKDVEGYEGLYQVSNYGRVKRFIGKKVKIERILKNNISSNKYYTVGLCKNGVATTKYIHVLTAIAFIKNKNNLPCINHKDGVKTNNLINNLEWCTYSQNTIHSHKIGLQISLKGEDRYNSKLKENDVINIRKRYKNGGVTQLELSKEFGVSDGTICKIVNNKCWKYLES